MSDIARLFGNRAGAYASFRPQYPPALFDWLAANSPAHGRALAGLRQQSGHGALLRIQGFMSPIHGFNLARSLSSA